MKNNKILLKQFNNQTLVLNNNLGIILGSANSGKTNILDTLNYGFLGQKKQIFFNDQIVSLGEYNVIYISDELMLPEDLKIAKNSDIKKYLISYLNQQLLINSNFEKVEELFENFKKNMDQIINNNLLNKIVIDELQLNTNIINLSLEKYLEKLITINLQNENNEEITIENFSKNKLRKLWYILLKNIKILDPKKTNVILIDCPELYGGPLEWKWWGNLINDLILENQICIFSTMNPYFLNYINWEFDNINFIFNNSIKHLSSVNLVNDYIIFTSFVENNEAEDLELYKSEIKKVILKEDIINENKNLKILFPNILENYLLNKKWVIKNNKEFKKKIYEIIFRYKIENSFDSIEFSEDAKTNFKINSWF